MRVARGPAVGIAAVVLCAACSEPVRLPVDDRLFVPEDLPNTPRDGEVGVTLKLVAFTLVQEPTGPALYAAVRNDGTTPSCSAGMTTDFVDKAGEIVTSSSVGLRSKQLYRIDDTTIIACIDPGQIAMSVQTTLPPEVVIAELGSLRHTFPTFGGFDSLVPVDGFAITDLQAVVKDTGGAAYTGTFTNRLDVTVSAPGVTIFPVNSVGRPLGAATATGTADVPAGGTWAFETSPVPDVGADHAAFPVATIP